MTHNDASGPDDATAGTGPGSPAANVDADEVAKFEALAARWWDPEGEFRPLHDLNPLRLSYIAERLPLDGARTLDVGCGGGLLTEALANAGAVATGVDMADGPLTVARLHALESGATVRYERATAESLVASEAGAFDLVTCLEMLEHVPDVGSVVAACAELTRPGGQLVFSTINRTPAAYALAVVGAEYVLNLLPRGTHDYAKFIQPAELAAHVRAAGLDVADVSGMRYNPFTRRASLTGSVAVNYLMHARKPEKH